jgi:uncharacterized protein (DUF1800 family)
MSTTDPIIALTRFGLGPRPGDMSLSDPRAALLAEIANPKVAVLEGGKLVDTVAALTQYREFKQARKDQRAADAAKPDAADAMAADDAMGADAMADSEMAPGKKNKPKKPGKGKRLDAASADKLRNYTLRIELPARIARLAEAPIGLGERLTMFWANHFAIESDNGGILKALVGPFEREAIRPNILGRFEDLLLAATRHPAMLIYLNNATSIGPDSKAGQKREAGLNENHARELMELHTLGVDGGYTQADVTSLAKILTGWSTGRSDKRPKGFGAFQFNGAAHEPGAQMLLGQNFDQKGEAQGLAALHLLASHPATATHIATKLVRSFVADVPPPELVAALARVFTDTGGDLQAVTRALIEADAAWTTPQTKLRTPQEFLYASVRALNVSPKPADLLQALTVLGQPLMNPPSPAGFADDTATWLAPDAMTNRLDIAQVLAAEAGDVDPRAVAEAVLGSRLSPTTAQTIARAESPAQGLALMLMSPEFQRR